MAIECFKGRGILPDPFPEGWWIKKDETCGNCTVAVEGAASKPIKGIKTKRGIVFDPKKANSDEQKVLNLFYFCNYMHDFFYMLGFDERAGNFQAVTSHQNLADPVLARVHEGDIYGTAHMTTPPDGQQPILNTGVVLSTGRHAALDSDVVFHEYAHGVSQRIIGGRGNNEALIEPQSRAMSEGWSDYFAITLRNYEKTPEEYILGDWVSGNPGGLRNAPYDSKYPAQFQDIGTEPYVEEHAIGEIWCAALMEMNRRLVQVLRDKRAGYELGWQIVIDGMKLTPANPDFLDGRDAIIRALEDLYREAVLTHSSFKRAWLATWQAFARFGMGENAKSNGPSLLGIVGDSAVPIQGPHASTIV